MWLTTAFYWLLSQWKWSLIPLGAKGLKMWFDLRKAKQDLKNSQIEGERLKHEVAKLDRERAVKDGAILLFRQAVAHTSEGATGFAILAKSKWASFLPDPSLIDEVLQQLKASKTPGIGDEREFWKIDYNPPDPFIRQRG